MNVSGLFLFFYRGELAMALLVLKYTRLASSIDASDKATGQNHAQHSYSL